MLRDPYSVLVVIENELNQFLAIQRSDDHSFWQSVTGGIESDENAIECAYREVMEETGIDCDALGLKIQDLNITNHYPIRDIWQHRYKPGSTTNTEYAFHLKVPSSIGINLNPDEHIEYQWVNHEQAMALFWSKSNRDVITAIHNHTFNV